MATGIAVQLSAGPIISALHDTSESSFSGLDMSTMLMMVEAHYNDLAGMLNSRMTQEQSRSDKLEKLQEVQGRISGRTNQPPDPGSPEAEALAKEIETNLLPLAADEDERTIIQSKIDYLNDKTKAGQPMQDKDLEDFNGLVKSKEDMLNGDSQMNLLKIQDVVGKIQSLMSSASNLVASAHDMQKSIIGNIRS